MPASEAEMNASAIQIDVRKVQMNASAIQTTAKRRTNFSLFIPVTEHASCFSRICRLSDKQTEVCFTLNADS